MNCLNAIDTLLVRPPSQEVQSVTQSFIGSLSSSLLRKVVIMGVCGNHLGVFDGCWNFDWASETIIVVALMISNFFNLRLGKIHCIDNNIVMDRLGSGSSRIIICNHEEVKAILTIILDNTCIYNSTWARIKNVTVILFKKPK
jgi:hypothetical protein